MHFDGNLFLSWRASSGAERDFPRPKSTAIAVSHCSSYSTKVQADVPEQISRASRIAGSRRADQVTHPLMVGVDSVGDNCPALCRGASTVAALASPAQRQTIAIGGMPGRPIPPTQLAISTRSLEISPRGSTASVASTRRPSIIQIGWAAPFESRNAEINH